MSTFRMSLSRFTSFSISLLLLINVLARGRGIEEEIIVTSLASYVNYTRFVLWHSLSLFTHRH